MVCYIIFVLLISAENYCVRFLEDNVMENVRLCDMYDENDRHLRKEEVKIGAECYALYSGNKRLYKAVIISKSGKKNSDVLYSLNYMNC